MDKLLELIDKGYDVRITSVKNTNIYCEGDECFDEAIVGVEFHWDTVVLSYFFCYDCRDGMCELIWVMVPRKQEETTNG